MYLKYHKSCLGPLGTVSPSSTLMWEEPMQVLNVKLFSETDQHAHGAGKPRLMIMNNVGLEPTIIG